MIQSKDEDKNYKAQGLHTIATILQCNKEMLYLAYEAEHALVSILNDYPGIKILDARTHSFGIGQGLTSILTLAESHASIHTYPEDYLMFFDLFTCGSFDMHEALVSDIARTFGGVAVNVQTIRRGL